MPIKKISEQIWSSGHSFTLFIVKINIRIWVGLRLRFLEQLPVISSQSDFATKWYITVQYLTVGILKTE